MAESIKKYKNKKVEIDFKIEVCQIKHKSPLFIQNLNKLRFFDNVLNS